MSDGRWYATGERLLLKILVTGGPATGKTSFVAAARGTGACDGPAGQGPAGQESAGQGSAGQEGAVPVPFPLRPCGPVVAYGPTNGTGEGEEGESEGTTVALDFGRIALRPDLTVCLFGVPGLERSAPLCEDLCAGALGAVVLVDTGRLAESFALVDRLEERALPFVVVVNRFAGPASYPPEQVASALGLSPSVPVLAGDVREATSVRQFLAELVAYTGRFRAARLLDAVLR